MALDRPRLAVLVNDDGGSGGKKSPKLRGKGVLLLEAVSGATSVAFPEARCLEESLSDGKVLIHSRGRHGLTLYYARPGRGGGWRTLSVVEVEAKSEVGAKSEELKLIEDKVQKTKLTPLLFIRV